MDTNTPDELGTAICEFTIANEMPVLFAGAGISQKIGLPGWDAYIEHLASVCDDYDASTEAKLIQERLEAGNHAAAATIYRTCDKIPVGERLKRLSRPFRIAADSTDFGPLENIADLDFSAYVTTNYDKVLHHTFASVNGTHPRPVELDDGTLNGAASDRSFFIARIHGRAEVPESMIVSKADYDNIEKDDDYLDFLMSMLVQRNCLFVGFSFLDPAITHVLDSYEDRAGPSYPELHLALLPSNVDQSLVQRLREYNIDVAGYDESRDHRDLWESFRLAAQKCGDHGKSEPKVDVAAKPRPALERYLAFSLVAARTEDRQAPVLDMVKSGVVRSALHNRDGSATPKAVKDEFRKAFHLSEEEAGRVAEETLSRMKRLGKIKPHNGQVALTDYDESPVAPGEIQALRTLSLSVVDRMQVREGVDPLGDATDAAASVLESVLLTRGWDLAAHYSGAATHWGSDLTDVVHETVEEVARDYTIGSPTAMARATLDLLTAPGESEAELLASLSRAAFALQLVLTSPRRVLFHDVPIPERLYLDASILLPAITPGHPYRPTYIDTIKKLRQLSSEHNRDFQMAVGRPFLEEIVEHRRSAREEVDRLGLNDRSNLARHISFYGATGTNVFIAGYASKVGRPTLGSKEPETSFEEFLRDVAPYTNEDELAEYLGTLGIQTVDMRFKTGEFSSHAPKFFGSLLSGYERIGATSYVDKDKVLVKHESLQLLQLHADPSGNSLFATADLKLQRAIAQSSKLSHLSSRVVTHIGMVTLVEVLSGLVTDSRSYARLMWGIPQSSREERVRNYLIDQALREYEPVVAMESPELATRLAREATIEADDIGVNLFDDSTPNSIARTARFLDRFEERFFEQMREAIKERRKRE